MRIDAIQTTLLGLIQALPVLANAQAQIRVDDGQQAQNMEADLNDSGLSILILNPECVGVKDSGDSNGALLDYVSEVWIRTNPKIVTNNAPTWNPLTIEGAMLTAVLSYGSAPLNFFKIPQHLAPETDYTDLGCNSRLIRFQTTVKV